MVRFMMAAPIGHAGEYGEEELQPPAALGYSRRSAPPLLQTREMGFQGVRLGSRRNECKSEDHRKVAFLKMRPCVSSDIWGGMSLDGVPANICTLVRATDVLFDLTLVEISKLVMQYFTQRR